MPEPTNLELFVQHQTAQLSRAQLEIQRLEAALIAAEAVNAERLEEIAELKARVVSLESYAYHLQESEGLDGDE